MSTTTIRISPEAHRVLKLVSESKGISMIEALDEITKAWERDHFFDRLNAAYAALKENPTAWAEEEEERSAWDHTLVDNIEDEDAHIP